MPILKTTNAPNGIQISFHRVIRLTVDLARNTAIAAVQSHTTEQAYLDGNSVAWEEPLLVPMSFINSGATILADLESALVAGTGLPYYGGTIIADKSDSLETFQLRIVSKLREACNAQILAGFRCDALGGDYLYPAKATDQTNLAGSIIDSLIPDLPADWVTPFWCADEAGVWAFRAHTAAQIQKVGRMGKAALLAAMGKNEMLAALVMSAHTKEQAALVSWNGPVPGPFEAPARTDEVPTEAAIEAAPRFISTDMIPPPPEAFASDRVSAPTPAAAPAREDAPTRAEETVVYP